MTWTDRRPRRRDPRWRKLMYWRHRHSHRGCSGCPWCKPSKYEPGVRSREENRWRREERDYA